MLFPFDAIIRIQYNIITNSLLLLTSIIIDIYLPNLLVFISFTLMQFSNTLVQRLRILPSNQLLFIILYSFVLGIIIFIYLHDLTNIFLI